MEAATEAVQEGVQTIAGKVSVPGKPNPTAEEVLDSMAFGAVIGGPMGGALGAEDVPWKKRLWHPRPGPGKGHSRRRSLCPRNKPQSLSNRCLPQPRSNSSLCSL